MFQVEYEGGHCGGNIAERKNIYAKQTPLVCVGMASLG
jgi:hypothetical protein